MSMMMNSVCEDCVRSYCSCSGSRWKQTLILHSFGGEDRNSSILRRAENDHSERVLPQLQQICPVQEHDQTVEGNCCLLHSRCSFCNGSVTPGCSWKRSVKRKIAQVSKEEELVEASASRMMLTQGTDSRNWRGLNVQECRSDMNGKEICLQENCSAKDCKGKAEESSEEQEEVRKLREALEAEHEAIKSLNVELEEERKAAAVAAMETMAMISRLQKEKAAVEMEAWQFQRVVEEKSLYDQDAICLLKEILMRKEEEKLSLEKEVQFYQQSLSDRSKGWGRENSYAQNAKGRELGMFLLEGKGIELNSLREHVPSPFERADASTRHSMIAEPPSFQTQPSSDNSCNDDLLKNSKGLDTEGTGTFDKTERVSADFAYRNPGKKLLESFNSAVSESRELGDVDLQQVKEEISTGEDVGLVDTMKTTSCGSSFGHMFAFPRKTNAIKSTILVQELPSKNMLKDGNLNTLQMWAEETSSTMSRLLTSENIERASSESSQGSALGKIHKASEKFSRSLEQEHMDEACKGFKGSVDAHKGIKGYDLESPRVEDNDRTLGWEDCSSAPVHDVYEVQHDHHEDSFPTCLRSKGDIAKQNEWKFLERYGNTWQNDTPSYYAQRSSRNPHGQFPNFALDNKFLNNGRMENPAELGCFETGNPENVLMDLRMRDRPGKPDSRMRGRLGKPEQMLGSVDCDHRGAKGRHGLAGKRKQTMHLSERQNSRSQADGSALDDTDDKSFFPSSDSSSAVLSYDVGETSLLTGDSSGIGVEDKVKQLTLRLQLLEADRESLKQTIQSFKKGNGEMQMLEDISQQLRQLRRAEIEVKEVHESTFRSTLKGILSFNSLRRSVLSQLGRLACLFLRGAHAGGGLTEPVGLTHVLANEGKLQATSCVTRELKAEVVLPVGLAIPADHAARIAPNTRHVTEWPTKTSGTFGAVPSG